MKLLLYKGLLLVTLLLIAYNLCFAGGEKKLVGGRSAAMGSASVALSDVWSAFNNQSALAALKKSTIGIYYENRFSLKELSYKAAVYAHPTRFGTFALDLSQFGFSLWNENQAGLAYSKSFGHFLALGTQLDFISINKGEPYGRFQFITFEVGALANFSQKIVFGAHIYNPVSARISRLSDERAPAKVNLGLSYAITKQFLVSSEIEKSIDEKVNFKTGIEYLLKDVIAIRTGISTNPALFSFGIGINLKKFSFDISTTRNQILGFSPQTSVTYAFE